MIVLVGLITGKYQVYKLFLICLLECSCVSCKRVISVLFLVIHCSASIMFSLLFVPLMLRVAAVVILFSLTHTRLFFQWGVREHGFPTVAADLLTMAFGGLDGSCSCWFASMFFCFLLLLRAMFLFIDLCLFLLLTASSLRGPLASGFLWVRPVSWGVRLRKPSRGNPAVPLTAISDTVATKIHFLSGLGCSLFCPAVNTLSINKWDLLKLFACAVLFCSDWTRVPQSGGFMKYAERPQS